MRAFLRAFAKTTSPMWLLYHTKCNKMRVLFWAPSLLQMANLRKTPKLRCLRMPQGAKRLVSMAVVGIMASHVQQNKGAGRLLYRRAFVVALGAKLARAYASL